MLARIGLAFGIAVAMLVASGGPVVADHGVPCHGAQRWPSFSDIAPSARRIVVGTVVDGGGRDFTLRVEEVLRGTARPHLRIDRLRSGLDLSRCGRGPWLIGNPGARQDSVGPTGELVVKIALVTGTDAHLKARLKGRTVRYDAVREAPAACEA